jgi:S1-C subfamily serine protease
VLELRLIAAALVAVGAFAGNAAAATKTTSFTQGVVLVTTNLAYENASAAGTGIVLTKSGEILTNNHVIRGATTIKVIVPAGKTYTASVIGYDVSDDIALIKVNGATNLATATRGNSAALKVGDATTAVGNANGGGRLVITHGRVTGLNRSITVTDEQVGSARLSGLIETSARLVPGDSGGPLLDAGGRVIGVDAAGSTNAAFTVADGYAIPINKAISLIKLMEAGQATSLVHIGKTAFLGASVADASAGGLTVQSVVPGLPAANAGLDQGWVITAVDGASVQTLNDLRTILFAHHPGDTVSLDVIDPFGTSQTVSVTLGDGPPQ